MPVTPVCSKPLPRYPTQEYLADHPELLRLVPARWRTNHLVLTALSVAISLLLARQSQAAEKGSSHVAPIFVHGEGRGAFGCEVVNPPVFLSEDEAQKVIRDEARKAGLNFTASPPAIRTLLPVTKLYLCPQESSATSTSEPAHEGDLVFDGYHREKEIAFEFVSHQDYKDWQTKHPACISTVSTYDIEAAARTLQARLAAKSPTNWIGVFYEPGAPAPRKRGEDELRKQVRDFIRWLKAQGVI